MYVSLCMSLFFYYVTLELELYKETIKKNQEE